MRVCRGSGTHGRDLARRSQEARSLPIKRQPEDDFLRILKPLAWVFTAGGRCVFISTSHISSLGTSPGYVFKTDRMARLIYFSVQVLLLINLACVLARPSRSLWQTRPMRLSCQGWFFQHQHWLQSLCQRLLDRTSNEVNSAPVPPDTSIARGESCRYTNWTDWTPVRFSRYDNEGNRHCNQSQAIVYERRRKEAANNPGRCPGPFRSENITCKPNFECQIAFAACHKTDVVLESLTDDVAVQRQQGRDLANVPK